MRIARLFLSRSKSIWSQGTVSRGTRATQTSRSLLGRLPQLKRSAPSPLARHLPTMEQRKNHGTVTRVTRLHHDRGEGTPCWSTHREQRLTAQRLVITDCIAGRCAQPVLTLSIGGVHENVSSQSRPCRGSRRVCLGGLRRLSADRHRHRNGLNARQCECGGLGACCCF